MNKKGERQWFYEVNGEGTFDVLFDGEKELRSVNQRWLKGIASDKAVQKAHARAVEKFSDIFRKLAQAD